MKKRNRARGRAKAGLALALALALACALAGAAMAAEADAEAVAGAADGPQEAFMQAALEEAYAGIEAGDGGPFGTVIVKDGEIIGRGHNETETGCDPTAHAEIVAIRQAAKRLGGWKLPGCSMYVTIEPCSMCAGAIVWSRIEKLYIGSMDPKAGACGSVFNIPQEKKLNHFVEIETGVMQAECSGIIRDFFKQLRKNKAEEKHQ